MKKRESLDLGYGIQLIDGYDLGFPGRTGTYVIDGEHPTLVETGPSSSVPYVLKGLNELSISPDQIEYIILTHIHLDHAGGAGLLVQECPNATVLVHEKGKRHLVNPSRLEAGARAVYGEKFDELFHPIVPIPEERLQIVKEGGTLDIAQNRTLTFLDTPGHAKHHIGIFDSYSQGLFIGDTAGIRYHQTQDYGLTFYLPTTSPNQFDPEAMHQSIDRFRGLNPKRLYFGHFGMSENPTHALDEVDSWLDVFVQEAEKSTDMEEMQKRLLTRISAFLNEHNVPEHHPVYSLLKLDLQVCTMGLADYLKKRR
ncbi:MBL fold metallo-hydrolase [Halobacillus fulvus]|nr:MBL fold metallo-hydrolase [Halobacillus fulvus]